MVFPTPEYTVHGTFVRYVPLLGVIPICAVASLLLPILATVSVSTLLKSS